MKNRNFFKKINLQKTKSRDLAGFTLVEIIISVGIFAAIIGLFGSFQSDIFSFNNIIQTGLQNQNEAKKVVRPFANEVRSASPSSLGGYPIKEATSTKFVFYSDVDNDGLKEEIRYYLEDNTFKKGVIKPSGSPLAYDEGDEQITKIIHDVVNETIFEYYDSSYDGTDTSNSLVYPFSVSEIRLVKINLMIDSNPEKSPEAISITTQVSIRNLKDNL